MDGTGYLLRSSGKDFGLSGKYTRDMGKRPAKTRLCVGF